MLLGVSLQPIRATLSTVYFSVDTAAITGIACKSRLTHRIGFMESRHGHLWFGTRLSLVEDCSGGMAEWPAVSATAASARRAAMHAL